jgi:hypothetical protein
MEIVYTEEERVEIRAQAMLAVIDFRMSCLRFLAQISIQSYEEEVAVTDHLLHALLFDDISLSIVAVECSEKSLLNG